MTDALPSFKLAVPNTAGQIPRPRQVVALQALLDVAAVVWLLGLPGAGKTSIAAQWLQQASARGERCIWYRLDEDDGDIAALLDALRHHPRHGAPDRLPAWSPEHRPDLQRFAQNFFARLVEGGPRLTLVLDDCHRVANDSDLYTLLDTARQAAGEQLRLVLISRLPPPLLLARGAVPGWLAVLDDLNLSLDEAVAVAERVSGRLWQGPQAETLRSAQGWLAHVLALARHPTQGQGWRHDAALPLGEFLCGELLLMLPAAERRGFRLLAELPELPRGLAGSAVPAPVARFLDQLTARRYFVDVTEGNAWRLHDLLRDGLREHNRQLESPLQLADARRRAAGWVAEDAPDTAMNLLVAAGDPAGALALLRRHGRVWLAQGRHAKLLTWLQSLPSSDAAGQAELTLWRAEALLPTAPEEARPLFAQSREALAASGEVEGAYRAWCGEVASYVLQWGAVQGLAELVDVLEALQARLGPPPGDWPQRCAADALTALMYGRAEDPRIRQWAQATAGTLQQAGDASSRIMAAAQLLIYRLWWSGDFPGGRALYDAFDAEVERGVGLSPLAQLVWWSNAAIIDWQCGAPARCHDKVERGLALAESSGVHVRDFFLLTQGMFCALSQEDWPRAEAYLARLAQTEHRHKRLDRMVHHFFRSWYCLSRGDAATALAHAQTALPMADAMGSLFHRVIVLSALAPAALHAGDVATAREAYRAQLALAKGSQNPTFAYIAFCAGAEIALVSGDTESLRKQVDRMLTVKRLGGFHSDCGWRTPIRAQLLAFALAEGLQPEVARQWIVEKRVPPPADCAGLPDDWPMPVRLRVIGGLRVSLAGQDEATGTPAAPVKPSTRLRELLAILVACRDGATQPQLCDWLWPDANGDKAAAALKVSVHRLRAWLGPAAVTVKDGRVALSPLCVACDLWALQDRSPERLAALAPQVLVGIDTLPVQQLRHRLALSRGA